MRIDLVFDSGFERVIFLALVALVLGAAFLLGSLIGPGVAVAEWDSSSSFGDSYHLSEIADGIDGCASELAEISRTLSDIEYNMP